MTIRCGPRRDRTDLASVDRAAVMTTVAGMMSSSAIPTATVTVTGAGLIAVDNVNPTAPRIAAHTIAVVRWA